MGAPGSSTNAIGVLVNRQGRRQIGRCVALCLATTMVLASIAPAAAWPEDDVKSAVVLSFLRYSEWPMSPADSHLTIGVMGRSSMAVTLRRNLEGRAVNNRTVHVIELKPDFDPRCCQIVYLATNRESEIRPVLANSRSSPVLTLGETDRFLDCGGAVNLMVVDGHMAFEVDLITLAQSGVVISSRLLRYGQVRRRPRA